jgi:hypothetical protein
VSMRERTGYRSLIYSAWHRAQNLRKLGLSAFDAWRIAMIDIDSCEYCARCQAPLALIETAHTSADPKHAHVTAKLARMAGIHAFSVSYQGRIEKSQCGECGRGRDSGEIEQFLVRQVHPDSGEVWSMIPEVYAKWLLTMRDGHECGWWQS